MRCKSFTGKGLPLFCHLFYATLGFTVQEEAIADALEAVSLLQKNGAVRADRIFVLGHSLGGMLIPRIGQHESAVAGFIIMAANARPLEDLILEQTLFQASLASDWINKQ
jgi:uncharacterized protein